MIGFPPRNWTAVRAARSGLGLRELRTQATLADPRQAACYIRAALEDPDQEMFLIALRDVAEARGRISKVATEAAVSRESVYRMLSKTGNPTHSSLRGILKALDLRLSVEAPAFATKRAAAKSRSIGRAYGPHTIPLGGRKATKGAAT
jgi:probable addiction module antidote protein